MIPMSASSRSTTPRPSQSQWTADAATSSRQWQGPEVGTEDRPCRQRSDTLDTSLSFSSTASSSSSAGPQTPETPSIMHVLSLDTPSSPLLAQRRKPVDLLQGNLHQRDAHGTEDRGYEAASLSTTPTHGAAFVRRDDPGNPAGIAASSRVGSTTAFGDSFRRRLDRSRHSFQSLRSRTHRRVHHSRSSTPSVVSRSTSSSDVTDPDRPRFERVKSLFARSRKGESDRRIEPPARGEPHSLAPAVLSVAGVLSRDYATPANAEDYFSIPARCDSAASGERLWDDALGQGESNPESAQDRHHQKEDVSLFESKLPREIKLLVLRHLVDSFDAHGGNHRWIGAVRGRRELVRLSRVSKTWRELCFDGHLWPLLELAPYAAHMHPKTLSALVAASRKCVKMLSLKGLERLTSGSLLDDLPNDPVSSLAVEPYFPSLTTLDLRGCANLSSPDLVRILIESPELETANLKGVQAVSSEVVRSIGRYNRKLQHLDVSRCWDLTLADFVAWLTNMDAAQASNMRSLRIAGIKSTGRGASDLLPLIAEKLVNLHVLDLNGCSHIYTRNVECFAETLRSAGRQSTLQHLVISSCSALTSATFAHLAGLLPDMQLLEMADMPQMYRSDDVDDSALVKLLSGMPHLRKLDMEGTGLYGGITNRVLEVLTPGVGSHRYDDEGHQVGMELQELRLGFAKGVTTPALIHLIRACPALRVLEVDNTAATVTVMREFVRLKSSADAHMSAIDCRAISASAYCVSAPRTRPRKGWTGHAALPFAYDCGRLNSPSADAVPTIGEFADLPVLKTYWSWKRVSAPPLWRESRAAGEAFAFDSGAAAFGAQKDGNGARQDGLSRPPDPSRRPSWRISRESDVDFVGRTSCSIM